MRRGYIYYMPNMEKYCFVFVKGKVKYGKLIICATKEGKVVNTVRLPLSTPTASCSFDKLISFFDDNAVLAPPSF